MVSSSVIGHPRVLGLGVLDDVVQRLLGDPVMRVLDVRLVPGRGPPGLIGEVEVGFDRKSAARGHRLDQASTAAWVPELIKGRGP